MLLAVAGALVVGAFVACGAFSGNSTTAAVDGGSGSDAAQDSNAPVDAGPPPPFCSQADAQFCADFDEGFLEQGWQSAVTNEAGIRLDDAAFVSPPASFLADMTHSPNAPTSNAAFLQKQLSAKQLSVLTCTFSVRSDANASNTKATIFNVNGTGTTAAGALSQFFNLWIALDANGSSALFTANATGAASSPATSAPIDAFDATSWTRLHMEVAFDTSCTASARVYKVDATGNLLPLMGMPFTFMTAPDGGPCADKDTTVQLGLSAPGGWLVRYDDFACNWSP
jgi:hypothetical protein